MYVYEEKTKETEKNSDPVESKVVVINQRHVIVVDHEEAFHLPQHAQSIWASSARAKDIIHLYRIFPAEWTFCGILTG